MQKAAKKSTISEVLLGPQEGWELRIGYFLELEHGLMGSFPAILAETEQVVVVLGKDLAKKVQNLLPARSAKINSWFFLINREEEVCFSIPHGTEVYHLELSVPQFFLSEETFKKLTRNHQLPFKWRPGLVG